jgi:hypothetical protein
MFGNNHFGQAFVSTQSKANQIQTLISQIFQVRINSYKYQGNGIGTKLSLEICFTSLWLSAHHFKLFIIPAGTYLDISLFYLYHEIKFEYFYTTSL